MTRRTHQRKDRFIRGERAFGGRQGSSDRASSTVLNAREKWRVAVEIVRLVEPLQVRRCVRQQENLFRSR